MKLFTKIFIVVALGLIVFNVTKINFNSPFEGDSTIAIISILALLCAILLLQIFRLAKRLEQHLKNKD